MANELTIGTAETPFISQVRNQGVVAYPFDGAAAKGTATTVVAAGAAATRHIVVALTIAVDTAGETLAIGGPTEAMSIPFPVAGLYQFVFDPPLECAAAAALTLDKGTVAGVKGYLHVIEAAVAGQMFRL